MNARMNSLPWSISPQSSLWRYAVAIVSVIVMGTCLSQAGELVSEDNEMLLYLGVLIFSALYLGRGPTRAATVTSLLILNLGRIHPAFRIGFQKFQYVISFAFFLVVSEQIARLADHVRREAWRAQELYFFTQECSRQTQPEAVFELLREHARWYCGVELEAGAEPARGVPLRTPRGIYGWTSPESKDNLLLESLRTLTALALERIAQDEVARQASVLEATQKLQSTLINSISHDLQTPLSSIRGSVETLRSLPIPASQQDELLDLALDQIRRLQKLMQNILHLSKMEAGGLTLSWHWVSLEEVLQGVIASLPEQVQGRIRLQPIVPSCEIRGDFALLSQLVSNVIDNALKFSTEFVDVEVVQNFNWVELSVSDRGFGIDTAEREKIFERFYRGRTPLQVPGSGLGLNICKAVTELHGGSILAQSRLGGGTTFRIRIPLEAGAHG